MLIEKGSRECQTKYNSSKTGCGSWEIAVAVNLIQFRSKLKEVRLGVRVVIVPGPRGFRLSFKRSC